ncbi:MAG TPA: DUF3619 family protein [Spongiibacteraceae bacterium]|nr:DUF3619 family protein [Spongiibacteraceae bacterium]
MNCTPDTLVDEVSAALDDSVEHLDARTLARLSHARRTALAQKVERPWRAWLGAAACASMLVVLVWPQPQTVSTINTAVLESDLELLEDLDMLTWLSAQKLLKDGTS